LVATRGPVSDASLAEAAAAAAAGALLRLRADGLHRPDIGRLGDRRSHEVLREVLEAARPEDAILSEEAPDGPERATRNRVWIIDPLDGTREYGEPGRTDWAIHVALVAQRRLSLGVVSLPALGLTFSSARPARLPPRSGRLRITVSRSRPPAWVASVSGRLGGVLMPMGSAGMKAMSILLGWCDVYLHAGGQYLWDSAAPVAVAQAAGLHASRIDGSPLEYDSHPAWQPDLLICRPELASSVLDAVQAVNV
jgi:3'(2'), 5'-bisphosphate nucleotidase